MGTSIWPPREYMLRKLTQFKRNYNWLFGASFLPSISNLAANWYDQLPDGQKKQQQLRYSNFCGNRVDDILANCIPFLCLCMYTRHSPRWLKMESAAAARAVKLLYLCMCMYISPLKINYYRISHSCSTLLTSHVEETKIDNFTRCLFLI
jgi:hypothetical protein